MTDKVSSAKAKIERANKHIKELEVELLRFEGTNPYKFTAQRDPKTRQLVYYVVEVAEIPVAMATVAADVLQNLRTALDHLIWSFADPRVRGPHTGFPIFDRAKAKQTFLEGKVKGVPPEAQEIVEQMKPYKGGNPILWRLHELNRIDKHQLLVPVASSSGPFNIGKHSAHVQYGASYIVVPNEKRGGFTVRIAEDRFVSPIRRLCPLKAGDVLLVDPPDSKVDENIDFRFHVSFSEPGIAECEPVIVTIHESRDLVAEIAARFAKLLP